MHRQRYVYLLGVGFVLSGVSLAAAPAKAPARPKAKAPAARPAPNTVKGQAQLQGLNGRFGTVYSLQDGFNFAILSARYSVDPFAAFTTLAPGTDEKLLILDVAIKNARPADNWWGTDDLFTAVDEKGELYPHKAIALQSVGTALFSPTLRPGQGLGQAEMKDPVQVVFSVRGDRRIAKIMVNQGRADRKDEKVLRYFVAGATKAEAGEDGDPRNQVAPLPESVRDPADASGAVALNEGKGAVGAYHPSGHFGLRLDGFAYSKEALLDGNPPEEGRRYAAATVTAKCLLDKVDSGAAGSLTMDDVRGLDGPLFEITDADGEQHKPVGFRMAKRDEEPACEFKKGREYAFRVVFALPEGAVAKKLILAASESRKWAVDVPAAK